MYLEPINLFLLLELVQLQQKSAGVFRQNPNQLRVLPKCSLLI